MSAPAAEAWRSRLIRFYTKYNQACLPSVDTILGTYAGREEELMRVLVNKYGQEPPRDGDEASPPPPAAAVTQPSSALAPSPRRRSVASSLDAATIPAGRQPTQPEPLFVSELHSRLRRMIERYDPPSHRSMDVSRLPIDEAASLLEVLVARCGPEPPATTAGGVDWRRLLEAFMTSHCPNELPKLDTLMINFKGRERDVYDAMHRRYPQPATPAVGNANTGTSASPAKGAGKAKRHLTLTAEERADLRIRLERYYSHYNPTKVSNIDQILDAFRGAPEELMAQVVEKYGPEPSAPHPTAAVASSSSSREDVTRGGSISNQVTHPHGDPAAIVAPTSASSTMSLPMPTLSSLSDQQQHAPPPPSPPMVNAATTSASAPVQPRRGADTPSNEQHSTTAAALTAAEVDSVLNELGSSAQPTPRVTPPPGATPSNATPNVPALLANVQRSTAPIAAKSAAAPTSRPIVEFPTQPPRDASSPARVVDAKQYNDMLAHVANTIGVGGSQSSSTARDWNSRIYYLYSFYRPDKLLHLGEKVLAHRGREAEWMALLLTKYGPEPPPRRPVRNNPVADEAFEGQLHALFTRHDPSMLPFVQLLVGDPSIARAEFVRDAQAKYASQRRSDSRHVSPHLQDHVLHPLRRRGSSVLAGLRSPMDDGSRAIEIEGPSTIAELEGAVRDLAVALDEKTTELEGMANKVRQAVEDRDMLENKVHELTARNSEVELENAKLREMVRQHTSHSEEITRLRAEVQLLRSGLERETAQLAQANSTVSIREHQNRVLRMQLQQLSEEVTLRDEKIKVALQSQQALADSLSERLKDVAALQLDLTPSSDPERFYAVVDEIQSAFRTHYDERIAADESEMKEYYQYAEQQITNREAIIEELLNALAATMRPTAGIDVMLNKDTAPNPRRSTSAFHTPEAGAQDDVNLADEVARLRMQVKMQEAEHSALLQAMALRQSASQVQPPLVQLGGAMSQQENPFGPGANNTSRAAILEESRTVQTIKRRMQEQEVAAKAQQAALAAELQRHMQDVGSLNDRLAMLEHERAVEAQRAQDLEARLRAVSQNATNNTTTDAGAPLGGGAVLGAAPSPTLDAERRAARALDMSEKLLEAAGRRTGAVTATATASSPQEPSPTNAARAQQANVLTESSKNLEQYFASARSDASNLPPWRSVAQTVPLPQAKTVWGLMYSGDGAV